MKRKLVSDDDSGSPAAKKSKQEITKFKFSNKTTSNVSSPAKKNENSRHRIEKKKLKNVKQNLKLIDTDNLSDKMQKSSANKSYDLVKISEDFSQKINKPNVTAEKIVSPLSKGGKNQNKSQRIGSKNSEDCNNNDSHIKVDKNSRNNNNSLTASDTNAKVMEKINIKKALLPKKPLEFSSNWKQLIKSGAVKYKKKKEAPKPGPVKCAGHAVTDGARQNTDEIWFDDVDQILIEPSVPAIKNKNRNVESTVSDSVKPSSELNPLVKLHSYEGLTKALAMDCEMVGVGYDGKDSILARVSLVNQYGRCVYDKYSRPTEKVTDYRTHVSGIRPADLTSDKALDFKQIQKEVCEMIKNRILVGHALRNDLKVLYLDHPRRLIRDTSRYKPFRQLFNGATPSLKKLTARLLGVSVQEGEHSSIQDAQAAMRLYTLHRKEWQKSIKERALAAGLRLDRNGKKKKILKRKSPDDTTGSNYKVNSKRLGSNRE